MSFFDQRCYALIKTNLCRVGLWPHQSQRVKHFLPLTILGFILTITGPTIIRIREVWGDANAIITIANQCLLVSIIFMYALNLMLKADEVKFMLEEIERHWKMFKNTPAVTILVKYAEYGRYIAIAYSMGTYSALGFVIMVTMSPVFMDFVDPLNKTRPRECFCEVSYGGYTDKYYWLMLAQCDIAMILSMGMVVASEGVYFLLIVHACSIFKVVDFAEQIESMFCVCTLLMMAVGTLLTSFAGIQILINMGDPAMLIRVASVNFGQMFNIYLNHLAGQKVIDHSVKMHTLAYDLDWYDMPIKSQKLWILILMRSEKPCCLTAGKLYMFSLRTFGKVIQTALSYFMVFSSLLTRSID